MKIKEIQKITSLTSMTVSTIISKAALGKIKLNPGEQRYAQWPAQYSMDLIDTMRAGLPVPSITAVYGKDGAYTIIDGRQRLTTILIMALGDMFKSIPHTGYSEGMSKTTIDSLLEAIKTEKQLFSGFEEEDQAQILDYRIPFTIVDLSEAERGLEKVINSILFDRLNRNSATMSNVNIYLSGLQQILFSEGQKFKKIKNELLPSINKMLGIKNVKKTFGMGTIVDIRSMKILVDRFELTDPGHVSLRYAKAFKEIENEYILGENKGKTDKQIEVAAEAELDILFGSLTALENSLKINKSLIGELKNETQRKAVIWLVLKGEINNVSPQGETIANRLVEIQSRPSYKEWQSRAGRTSPQRLYHLLNILFNAATDEVAEPAIQDPTTTEGADETR